MTKRKRIGKLQTAKDARRYIARCIRTAERENTSESVNTHYKLVMMASMLVKAIEMADLEERITKLETTQISE